jgi:hypothetical protein
LPRVSSCSCRYGGRSKEKRREREELLNQQSNRSGARCSYGNDQHRREKRSRGKLWERESAESRGSSSSEPQRYGSKERLAEKIQQPNLGERAGGSLGEATVGARTCGCSLGMQQADRAVRGNEQSDGLGAHASEREQGIAGSNQPNRWKTRERPKDQRTSRRRKQPRQGTSLERESNRLHAKQPVQQSTSSRGLTVIVRCYELFAKMGI